jgi:hypothetical protein
MEIDLFEPVVFLRDGEDDEEEGEEDGKESADGMENLGEFEDDEVEG